MYNSSLSVPSLHERIRRDSDAEFTGLYSSGEPPVGHSGMVGPSDEGDTNERPYPRVTLSWENLRYAIHTTQSAGWRGSLKQVCSMWGTSKDQAAHTRPGRKRARSASLFSDSTAEELLQHIEEDDDGQVEAAAEDYAAEKSLLEEHEREQYPDEEEGLKQILRGVEGIVYPGELCAIMGASGAGKTTLLDVLACRGVKGRLSGDVKINGQPIRKRQGFFRRVSGYVMQDNVMLETLSVRETISFAARLRLPSQMTRQQKEERVDRVMDELRLNHIANSKVGGAAHRSISGGELKRVAIALELVSLPSLLFLDEPTSGLDSNGATDLVLMLKGLAKQGQRTILCTIHQPSAPMCRAFDKLLLLSQGRVVYFGKADRVVPYFCGLGIRPPPETNPAEFIIDIAFHARRKDMKLEETNKEKAAQSLVVKTNENISINDSDVTEDLNPAPKDEQRDVERGVLPQINLLRGSKQNHRQRGNSYCFTPASDLQETVPSTPELASMYRRSTWYQSVIKELALERSQSRKRYYESENSIKAESSGVSIFMQMWILLLREAKYLARHTDLFYSRLAVQIIMGFVMGSLWFQLGQDNLYVQNCLGVMYMTVTMLSFTSFSSVASYIEHNVVFHRERAAGMYEPFPYFASKVLVAFSFLAVLVLIECSIVYWMVGLRSDAWHYFAFFCLVLILAAWTAEALIFAISATTRGVQVAQVSFAFVLGFFFLFAGFLISSHSIPRYYAWAKYSSFIKYAFEALTYNEFVGRVVGGVPGETIISQSTEGLNVWTNVGVLGGMTIFYLLLAFLALQFFNKEKR